MNLQMKRIREDLRMSQKEVASRIGVPVRRYGSWERGERNMNLEDAALIADVLNCTLDELAGRDFSPSQYSDKRQQTLNHCYSMLDERSKGELAGLASTMTADASRLAVKSGEDSEAVGLGEAV